MTINLNPWVNAGMAAILLASVGTLPWWGILAGALLVLDLTSAGRICKP